MSFSPEVPGGGYLLIRAGKGKSKGEKYLRLNMSQTGLLTDLYPEVIKEPQAMKLKCCCDLNICVSPKLLGRNLMAKVVIFAGGTFRK